ncbi:MAG: hypothetical protein AB1779_07325 [Candidatus Thermoplasmatota archaeon]
MVKLTAFATGFIIFFMFVMPAIVFLTWISPISRKYNMQLGDVLLLGILAGIALALIFGIIFAFLARRRNNEDLRKDNFQ